MTGGLKECRSSGDWVLAAYHSTGNHLVIHWRIFLRNAGSETGIGFGMVTAGVIEDLANHINRWNRHLVNWQRDRLWPDILAELLPEHAELIEQVAQEICIQNLTGGNHASNR